MILYADKLIGVKAEHNVAPLNNHKVNDILFNKYDHRLCFFTYAEESYNKERKDRPSDKMETVVASTANIGTQNTPMTGSAFTDTDFSSTKEIYYIPFHQVINMEEDKIIFKGNERQTDEPTECYSFLSVKDWSVIDQNGEKIGKIKDLVMDTERQQVVGFVLSEGFWKKLLGHDEKYMPVTGIPDFKNQEWRIEQTPDLLLRNHPEEL